MKKIHFTVKKQITFHNIIYQLPQIQCKKYINFDDVIIGGNALYRAMGGGGGDNVC